MALGGLSESELQDVQTKLDYARILLKMHGINNFYVYYDPHLYYTSRYVLKLGKKHKGASYYTRMYTRYPKDVWHQTITYRSVDALISGIGRLGKRVEENPNKYWYVNHIWDN